MKALSFVFAGLMIVLGAFNQYIQASYAYTRPTQPEQTSGRIYEFNMRGRIVYLNKREHLVAFWTFKCALLAGVVSGGLWVASEKKKNKKP